MYLPLERLEDAQSRGAKIIAEVIGYRINSDASTTSYLTPSVKRSACARPSTWQKYSPQVDIVNTHATSTPMGDIQEIKAIRGSLVIANHLYK